MEAWDASMEKTCRAHVAALCGGSLLQPERDRIWKALLVAISPHVEAWAWRSPLLRRSSLGTRDDARSVLIEVISRLAQHDFGNLRRFLSSLSSGSAEDDEELEVVERLSRLQSDVDVAEPKEEAQEATPLRAWLLGLTRFAIKDHLKAHLGRSKMNRGARHALNSGAERFDDQPELGARPPITDLIGLRRLLEAMRGYAETFPLEMQKALTLWMNDEGFEEIATRLRLESADRARALVRAAQARLREKFREADLTA
jgi:hypothetical protein